MAMYQLLYVGELTKGLFSSHNLSDTQRIFHVVC